MKIKLYIVTYNNSKELNKTLNSLYDNMGDHKHSFEINVINNHSNYSVDDPYMVCNTYHNTLRPDFSTGHLSRNWNQGLILGFENLKKPACDIVCLCQDDTEFMENWVEKLIKLHKKYDFTAFGWGDNFMSFTPNAVKKVGLFDERFPLGGVAPDYFLRCLKFLKDKISINDYHHGRVFNPEDELKVADRPAVPLLHASDRKENKPYIEAMFVHKYPFMKHCSQGWNNYIKNNPNDIVFGCKSYVLYPYFEKDIETLEQQNYLLGGK